MREVLKNGGDVVTLNKWPVALAGVELVELARKRGVAFRAESTVMSGTPVLGPLTTVLAGTTPITVRGVLNATCNAVLTMMREGRSYTEALAAAQADGLAEPDPAADVGGHDAVAKVMILSALLAGRQLRRSDVGCRGISAMTEAELQAAADPDQHMRELSNLEFVAASEGGEVRASVQPTLLATDHPLSRIEGTTNAIVCTADPLGEIQISGPGAGPHIAGYGCFIDLLALGRT